MKYEIHITPKKEFRDDFIEICERYKLKIISHDNLNRSGEFLYNEVMLAEKCKELSDLNYILELMNRICRQHNILRVKVESVINDDFTYTYPYKMGSNYHEIHIDIKVPVIDSIISEICNDYGLDISKNPKKDTYMLTHRNDNLDKFRDNCNLIIQVLLDNKIEVKRIIKEYCFLDDNISVDNPWLKNK